MYEVKAIRINFLQAQKQKFSWKLKVLELIYFFEKFENKPLNVK